MKEFFKNDDFHFAWLDMYDTRRVDIVETCNIKLNKMIESWPVVYTDHNVWEEEIFYKDKYTHKARLAFIEEIKKEPCQHYPIEYVGKFGDTDRCWKCKHCGVERQATWSEKNV